MEGRVFCTLIEALAAGMSKACFDIGAVRSDFPRISERCRCAFHQPTIRPEVISHYVVEIPTQTCWMRQHTFTQLLKMNTMESNTNQSRVEIQ